MSKRLDYLSWQHYFMLIAKASAMRSKDPNTQVGAIVVNELQQIVATGYNGFPRGVSDDDFPWSKTNEDWLENKYAYVAHAELNAIVSSRSDLSNCDLYVTLFPCNECAKIIIQAGIKRIYYANDPYYQKKEFIASKKMLDAVNIKYIKLPDIEISLKVKD
ncbi:dCMP deaminase family protein [Mycoplasma capricolum subsp. capricolum]|uniref:deoxycytidylate deaminase n=1 Tax=Mycoplasma capricolum TaxID=2095 RepID=UPI0020BEFB0F|nr:dCMP deaminase family protein [Mycoplasma capricolum]MCK8461605.1 dCMP deaminase family protein [Mycoplasma capricolum subsp. capricolum]